MERFSDNLVRLIGLHALTAKEAAHLLGMSASAFSKWAAGARQPSFPTALAVGEFFQVPADRLARAEFADLLANELSSPERFRTVEQEIHRRRSGLQVVPSDQPVVIGKPGEMLPGARRVSKRQRTKK